MEFNQIIKIQFLPILQRYGFKILEESKHKVCFGSFFVKIDIIYNDREKSYYVSIGKYEEISYPLNNYTVKEFFHSDLMIDNLTLEMFIKNFSALLETKEGIKILKGDVESFTLFKLAEINNFNVSLIQKQEIEKASRAWQENDYKFFIEILDKIGIDKMPESYRIKYNIAEQRIKNNFKNE